MRSSGCRRWRRSGPEPDFPSVFIPGCAPLLDPDDVGEGSQMKTVNDNRVLIAPERLVAGTRAEFRSAAVKLMESMPRRSGTITLDLGATREIDATGLGTLVAIQNRAKQAGLNVKLANVTEEVHTLLALTELLHLFVIEHA